MIAASRQFAAPPRFEGPGARPILRARRAALRRLEAPEIRIPGRAVREAEENQRDLERLIEAAALEQAAFFRVMEEAYLRQALEAFQARRDFVVPPFVAVDLMMEHLVRLTRLLAAARALGELRVRLEGGLLEKKGRSFERVENVEEQTSFAEVLKGIAPRDALRYLERLPVIERSKWEAFIARSGQQAFTAAGVENRAALESLKRLVVESLRSGLTPEQFARNARLLLQEFQTSAGRLRTLWNTSVGNALQRGREEALEDPEVASLLTHGRFVALLDFATRPNHRALHNAVATRDFWLAHFELRPLLGWNCRCDIIWITAGRARRLLDSGQGWDLEAQGVPALAGLDAGFEKAA